MLLHLKHRGPNVFACDAPFAKGQEMGWFEHGSTIIVFAPSGFSLATTVEEGATIRMGEPFAAVAVTTSHTSARNNRLMLRGGDSLEA